MSSLRNATQRRNHRERAQPAERAKWGLLEKHKDYSKRAADHNTKKRKIRSLQQKASERNEDEFYFGMVSGSTANGIKRAKRGDENGEGSGRSLREETVRLMKTQDQGYLRTMLQKTRKERERVEQEVKVQETGVSCTAGKKRILFAGDREEMEVVVPKAESADLDEDLDGMSEDSDGSDGKTQPPKPVSKPEFLRWRLHRRTLRTKQRQLEALQDREEQLTLALKGVDDQRAKMHNTVGGVNKSGTAFKMRQRKT